MKRNKRNIHFIIIFIIIYSFFYIERSETKTLWISTKGTNNTICDEISPCNFDYGCSIVEKNDILYVDDGEYPLAVFIPSNNVTLLGHSQDKTIFKITQEMKEEEGRGLQTYSSIHLKNFTLSIENTSVNVAAILILIDNPLIDFDNDLFETTIENITIKGKMEKTGSIITFTSNSSISLSNISILNYTQNFGNSFEISSPKITFDQFLQKNSTTYYLFDFISSSITITGFTASNSHIQLPLQTTSLSFNNLTLETILKDWNLFDIRTGQSIYVNGNLSIDGMYYKECIVLSGQSFFVNSLTSFDFVHILNSFVDNFINYPPYFFQANEFGEISILNTTIQNARLNFKSISERVNISESSMTNCSFSIYSLAGYFDNFAVTSSEIYFYFYFPNFFDDLSGNFILRNSSYVGYTENSFSNFEISNENEKEATIELIDTLFNNVKNGIIDFKGNMNVTIENCNFGTINYGNFGSYWIKYCPVEGSIYINGSNTVYQNNANIIANPSNCSISCDQQVQYVCDTIYDDNIDTGFNGKRVAYLIVFSLVIINILTIILFTIIIKVRKYRVMKQVRENYQNIEINNLVDDL